MSYIVAATTALIRLSTAAALSAKPPNPQMPMMPTRLRSTEECRPRKSTAALKSSVLMSGDGTLRGSPLLSPVYDGSNARATYPRSAIVCAYSPDDCSFTAPNGPLTARAPPAACVRRGPVGRVQITGEGDAVAVPERHLLMIDLLAPGEGLVPLLARLHGVLLVDGGSCLKQPGLPDCEQYRARFGHAPEASVSRNRVLLYLPIHGPLLCFDFQVSSDMESTRRPGWGR